jgi:hypothetical protein
VDRTEERPEELCIDEDPVAQTSSEVTTLPRTYSLGHGLMMVWLEFGLIE